MPTVQAEFEPIVKIRIEKPWWARHAGRILAWEINVLYWLSRRYDIRME